GWLRRPDERRRTMTVTVPAYEVLTAVPEEDPFRYGWREVCRREPDGSYRIVNLPLTLWDVLHPQENDKIMNGLRHARECRYLASVLEARLAGDPHALVLHDTAVYWGV